MHRLVDLVVVQMVQDQMVAVVVEDILEEMEDGLLVVVDLIWSASGTSNYSESFDGNKNVVGNSAQYHGYIQITKL